jgi:disulfide bond formation protein DsbB
MALYLQIIQHAEPCVLCVVQRYAYVSIVLLALAGMFVRSAKNRICIRSSIALIALGGMLAAGRQLWVLSDSFAQCSRDSLQIFLNSLPFANFFPWLFKVTGLCESSAFPLWGTSVPVWSLISYGFIELLILSIGRHKSF